MTAMALPGDVVAFWRDAGPDRWFKRDEAFDQDIRRRFLATYEAGARGELETWTETSESALALVIVLDQFPRNMFRGDARAFATDTKARGVADRATARGFDRAVPTSERLFFYLPFEHSESEADQARAIALIAALGDADLTRWAQLHADIIKRFGRFPHRNTALGRTSTREEQAFLDAGGFSG